MFTHSKLATVTEPYPYSGQLTPRLGGLHSAVIDDVDTHWWVFDAHPGARTIVMVHGYRGDHHGLQLFADALPEFRVIIPDLPSFGESGSWPYGVHSIEDFGRWLRAFLDHTNTNDSPVLGHSFGSIVVSHGLATRTDAPMILINPISQKALTGPKRILAALGSSWYVVGGKLPERLGRAFLSAPLIVRVMSSLLAKTRDKSLRRWIHEQHALYFSRFSDRDSLIGGYRVSTTNDVSDVASRITAPVLLVAAAEDDITPLDAQRRVEAMFPKATLRVIDGVGHLVHYEKPIAAAEHIRTFLAEN